MGYPSHMGTTTRGDAERFAAWIRELMTARGYELEGHKAGGMTRLAQDSGLSLTAISRTVNGQRIPELETLIVLARTLGVTVREMLLHTGKVGEEDLPAVVHATPPPPEDLVIAAIQASTVLTKGEKRDLIEARKAQIAADVDNAQRVLRVVEDGSRSHARLTAS